MTRDGEMAARDYLELVLHGIGKESRHRRGAVAAPPGQAGARHCTPPRPGARPGWPAGREATAEHLRVRGPRQRPPARLGPRLRRAPPARPSSSTVLAGLLDGTRVLRGPGRRHRPALGAADPAGRDRPGRRGGDRRRAGPRPHLGRRAARRRGPRRPARRRGQGRRPGRRSSRTTSCPTPCRRRSSAASCRATSASCSPPTPSGTSPRSSRCGRPAATRWPSRSSSGSTRRYQVSQETLDATDAWLASADPAPALRRLVVESRSGVERALRAQRGGRGAGA